MAIVDDPALGDPFFLSQCNFNLSVRDGAGRHIDHDGRLFVTWKGDGDRIGAEHSFCAPQGRHELCRIGHSPADEISLKRLQRVVAGDTKMIRIAHAHPA